MKYHGGNVNIIGLMWKRVQRARHIVNNMKRKDDL